MVISMVMDQTRIHIRVLIISVCLPTEVRNVEMTIFEKNRNPTVENSLFRVMLTTLAGKKAM
jgi:hypothetical protein